MQIQDLKLPGNIHIPVETLEGFLWGGRESGIRWLNQLPALVESVCEQHQIVDLRPSPELRMNLVLFGESAIHGPIVLKMAQPHRESSNEIAATRVMNTTGRYARLIDADESGSWILLERVHPGQMLQALAQTGEVSDEDATRIAATLMLETVRPVPEDATYKFPDIEQWLHSLWEHHRNNKGIIPKEQLDLAIQHARDMVANPDEPVLLHGDFHHGNILTSPNGWTMIDPKGMVGHLAFEVGPFFYNPIGIDRRQDLEEVYARRLDIFEELLGIDRVMLWRNALVGMVLSDCWSLEVGPVDHTHFNTVTAAFMRLPERFA